MGVNQKEGLNQPIREHVQALCRALPKLFHNFNLLTVFREIIRERETSMKSANLYVHDDFCFYVTDGARNNVSVRCLYPRFLVIPPCRIRKSFEGALATSTVLARQSPQSQRPVRTVAMLSEGDGPPGPFFSSNIPGCCENHSRNSWKLYHFSTDSKETNCSGIAKIESSNTAAVFFFHAKKLHLKLSVC